MPAVVRIDTGGTHGYQARIGGSVGYESKLFSDKKWGGKRKAKAAAIAWLEERGDRYAPRRFGPKKGIQVNNVSGTPGVHQSQLTRNGNVSRYWAAHYSIGPNGRRTHRSKRFYYGTKRTEAEARALAEEFRTGWVEAFERDGVNGVKQFFREWEEKYPSRKTKKKKSTRGTAKKSSPSESKSSTKAASSGSGAGKSGTTARKSGKTSATRDSSRKSGSTAKKSGSTAGKSGSTARKSPSTSKSKSKSKSSKK
ncbi:MAG: hypothetical protein ACOCW3_00655 [Spirochaetota bacterium]